MEEILARLGVPTESWIIAMFFATLIVIYRVFESEEPLSRRKTIRIIIMGMSSILLVPGLLVHWMHVQNPFMSGGLTGLSVYCFEPLLALAQRKLMNKIDNNDLHGSN